MQKRANSFIALGVDPGTHVTGYALVEYSHPNYRPLDFGCICPPKKLDLPQKYLYIYEGIQTLLQNFHPDFAAFEDQFVHKNPKTALKLGMAKCAAMLPCTQRNLPITEYSPVEIKRAVTGNHRAHKQQVAMMSKSLLGLSQIPSPSDITDAIAIAICRLHENSRVLVA